MVSSPREKAVEAQLRRGRRTQRNDRFAGQQPYELTFHPTGLDIELRDAYNHGWMTPEVE